MTRYAPLLLIALLWAPPSLAQNAMADVTIETVQVADNLYMLVGRGGNIGLSVGDDGAFMIDDQFAPLTDTILEAVAALTDASVRFVVNTHWHGDHTGGNENMGAAGALIVAHENVRRRMSTEPFTAAVNRTTPPSPEAALPVITFTDEVTFHWNDDVLRVLHLLHAHTDGDAVIHFAEAHAVHMGDTYFNGFYPYIDVSAGGTIDGVIHVARTVIEMSDEDTAILPGHGPLSSQAELQAYHDLLVELRDGIQALIDQGLGRDEVIAAKPTRAYDAQYGQGFMQPDLCTGLVYDSLTK
ncbi:MAG: MBL fold metallo-hydrolase [Bacteroidota bacterium]